MTVLFRCRIEKPLLDKAIGTQQMSIERPPASKVVLCLHPGGHHSVLAARPSAKEKPALLFTNRPS